MYKLTKSINQAVQECLEIGPSTINLEDTDNTIINTYWEPFKQDEKYDVVTVYISQNGLDLFNYQIEETKVLSE